MDMSTAKTPQKTITLEGLPDEAARAFELMVEAWRKQTAKTAVAKRQRIDFAVWPGTVHGKLTRREIYDYL